MQNIILAQFVGFISFIFTIYSMQKNKKNEILLYNGIANFFCSTQYFLLNAYTGAISTLFAVIRNIIFYKFKSKEIPMYLLLIYIFIAIIINIPCYDGWISLLPLISIIIYGYGIWQSNVEKLKIIMIVVGILAIIYDIYYLAIVDIFISGITIISGVIGYYRYKMLSLK